MTCMVSSKNVETSRDLKGNENDSDEQIPEDMSCNKETWMKHYKIRIFGTLMSIGTI